MYECWSDRAGLGWALGRDIGEGRASELRKLMNLMKRDCFDIRASFWKKLHRCTSPYIDTKLHCLNRIENKKLLGVSPFNFTIDTFPLVYIVCSSMVLEAASVALQWPSRLDSTLGSGGAGNNLPWSFGANSVWLRGNSKNCHSIHLHLIFQKGREWKVGKP
jgi:hypothetical protein